jgi:diaminopropionate ammonia-lyase
MLGMNDWYCNPAARGWSSKQAAPAARSFHVSLPGYAPTPLVELPTVATELGVGRLLVKDESARLGLPAFKVLGASWACKQVLDRKPGAVLVTATDGNHGRAVARKAPHFGTTATGFVPHVMQEEAAGRIVAEGARVVRVDGDYDQTVRAAAEHATADEHRALVQDTAWPGYEDVPAWIVEGYETLVAEVDEALGCAPDLVVVPVGVGSLAQAVVAHYRRPGVAHPSVLSVEPDTAACLLTSLAHGAPTSVATGATVMAGLNCGTVSSSAWPVLQRGCDAAVAVTDDDALQASSDLKSLDVSSGACGAATLAGARAVLLDSRRRADLDVPDDAVVVLLSTEGLQSTNAAPARTSDPDCWTEAGTKDPRQDRAAPAQ